MIPVVPSWCSSSTREALFVEALDGGEGLWRLVRVMDVDRRRGDVGRAALVQLEGAIRWVMERMGAC